MSATERPTDAEIDDLIDDMEAGWVADHRRDDVRAVVREWASALLAAEREVRAGEVGLFRRQRDEARSERDELAAACKTAVKAMTSKGLLRATPVLSEATATLRAALARVESAGPGGTKP